GMEYLRIARDIALTHHERYDGTGYPYGLKGDAIPLCGRVVALCDVYDALISQRVYKRALPHNLARLIILSSAGTCFDPRVVQAFLSAENEILQIVRVFAELRSEVPLLENFSE
ncbi:MAG: HD-GYP domain-containing protein, partial [Kiritimatiellia bacterium]